MAHSKRMSVQKRLRERKKAEAAELKRQSARATRREPATEPAALATPSRLRPSVLRRKARP